VDSLKVTLRRRRGWLRGFMEYQLQRSLAGQRTGRKMVASLSEFGTAAFAALPEGSAWHVVGHMAKIGSTLRLSKRSSVFPLRLKKEREKCLKVARK